MMRCSASAIRRSTRQSHNVCASVKLRHRRRGSRTQRGRFPPQLITSLLAEGDWPILMLDGGSSDSSRDIIRSHAAASNRLILVDNHGTTQARAINLAAEWADRNGASTLVRIDAHSHYPRGYVSTVARLLTEAAADSVVSLRLVNPQYAKTSWQTAAALFLNHPLGHRGAVYRRANARAGFAAHGHHAAYRLSTFRALGGYDARLPAAEDLDYDQRLRAAGGRIHLQTSHPVTYLPRASLAALFRQYHRNGYGRHLRRPLPMALRAIVITSLITISTFWWIVPLFALGITALLALHAARSRPALFPYVLAVSLAAYGGFAIGRLGSPPRAKTEAAPALHAQEQAA